MANLRASLMERLDIYAIAQLRAGLAAVAASGTTITLSAFASHERYADQWFRGTEPWEMFGCW